MLMIVQERERQRERERSHRNNNKPTMRLVLSPSSTTTTTKLCIIKQHINVVRAAVLTMIVLLCCIDERPTCFAEALSSNAPKTIKTTTSSSTTTRTSTITPTIVYRKAKASDIPKIAKLLKETFDDEEEAIPFLWKMFRSQQILNQYQQQLEKRMEELVKAGAQHALIVAVAEEEKEETQNKIAGFMELGTLPSPIPIQNTNTTTTNTWMGVQETTTIATSRPEMPYLANVAVDKDYRRQRIGTKLVRLAIKIASKWYPNVVKQQEQEQQQQQSGNKNDEDENKTAEKTLRTETTTTATDTITTNENVALYLAVEKENRAAVRLYENMDFCKVIDETEKLSQPQLKKLQRKPRLYFERKLYPQEQQQQQHQEREDHGE